MTDSEEFLTLKDLVGRVAVTNESDERLRVARQVQHWINLGLFECLNLEPADKRVGRGRARQYPALAVPYCRLMRATANRNFSIKDMIKVLIVVHTQIVTAKDRKRANLVLRAIAGTGPDVLLAMQTKENPYGSAKLFVREAPLTFDTSWSGAVILNLTRIFAGERY